MEMYMHLAAGIPLRYISPLLASCYIGIWSRRSCCMAYKFSQTIFTLPRLPTSTCCDELRHYCSFIFFTINFPHLSTNPRSFPILRHLVRTHAFSFASLKAPFTTPTCITTPCCPCAQIHGRIHQLSLCVVFFRTVATTMVSPAIGL